jgi:UDP-N-acetylglucosamine:LPS N-acetylglucosamine transferase
MRNFLGLRKNKTSNGAWVVAVDMGYGHLRAALPFKDIAQHGSILTANEYPGIPEADKKIWQDSRNFYETISRFKKFPVLGDFVFALFDKFQEIQEFYPSNESIEAPTLQLRQVYRLFEKKHWGEHLISQLNKNPLPLLCTFFIPAYMAEFWGYKAPIYLVIPDSDVSRAWAPLRPKESRIVYCASTQRAAARLKRYGVSQKQIVVTGFPLLQEFTRHHAKKAKNDLKRRLQVLDPTETYIQKYKEIVERYVGKVTKKKRTIVLTFAIGGAGAQAEIAEDIMEGVQSLTKERELEFHIIAGIHKNIATALKQKAGKNIFVHYSANKKQYFQDFSKIISKTDILWTKPSELVFYAGLGIPIIIAPPIGSQEVCNRKWLLGVGAGIDQKKPELVSQWLPDLVEEGVFAEAAMQGFVEIPKDGAEKIKKLICGS